MRIPIRKSLMCLVAGMMLFAACGGISQDNFKKPEGTGNSKLEVPRLQDRIMDLAGILKDSEAAELKAKLKQLETDTTAQMAILVIPDLQGDKLEEYSLKVANTWKLGQKDLNNGVLILVAMRNRALRIEVGLGLETVLTDDACKKIIDDDMIPLFRQGEYYRGLDKGVAALIGLLNPQRSR
jgi:uncharacterized protein